MFKALNAKCLRRWALTAPWALAPGGQLGPGPKGPCRGPGPKGANWARAPRAPGARAQRGQLGPGPQEILGPGPKGANWARAPKDSMNQNWFLI